MWLHAMHRLSAIMERFDEVDLSGRQVPSNENIAPTPPSGSHDAKSHNTVTSSTTKQLPVGKPPIGSVSKVDAHRVAGMSIDESCELYNDYCIMIIV